MNRKDFPVKTENPPVIWQFQENFRFLSNFWPVKIKYQGLKYPSSENAYHAAKCQQPNDKLKFVGLSEAHAKRLGKRVECRADWNQVKLQVMEEILRLKFEPGSELAKKLIETEPYTLIEGNLWNDTYWGAPLTSIKLDGTYTGENHLGKLLMKLREELLQ